MKRLWCWLGLHEWGYRTRRNEYGSRRGLCCDWCGLWHKSSAVKYRGETTQEDTPDV